MKEELYSYLAPSFKECLIAPKRALCESGSGLDWYDEESLDGE